MNSTTDNLQGNQLFQELAAVLYRHLDSRITADTILKRLIDEEDVNPRTFQRADLERIFGSVVFVSVRMFCPPDKLPTAMVELAALMSDELQQSFTGS